MTSQSDRLAAANAMLAPYAVPLEGTLGRPVPEAEDETRLPFQRDRARIIHSQAFRRLQGKTQVFVAGEGDHYRTRLTHTMEVTQLSRDIARTLRLNEDLTECIALAHDLGHPPFGHMGEMALDQWMQDHKRRFEHNDQSLRVVQLLEHHSPHAPGLNLNQEVLEGLQKHREGDGHVRSLGLEAQLVNIADQIAYLAHDCEDGVAADILQEEKLHRLALIKRAREHAEARGTSLRGAIITLLVTDLYRETGSCVEGMQSLDEVYAATQPLICFSKDMQSMIDELHMYLMDKLYLHPTVTKRGREGQELIIQLCNRYSEHPIPPIVELQTQTGSPIIETVKDYVAGMTDAYARAQASA